MAATSCPVLRIHSVITPRRTVEASLAARMPAYTASAAVPPHERFATAR